MVKTVEKGTCKTVPTVAFISFHVLPLLVLDQLRGLFAYKPIIWRKEESWEHTKLLTWGPTHKEIWKKSSYFFQYRIFLVEISTPEATFDGYLCRGHIDSWFGRNWIDTKLCRLFFTTTYPHLRSSEWQLFRLDSRDNGSCECKLESTLGTCSAYTYVRRIRNWVHALYSMVSMHSESAMWLFQITYSKWIHDVTVSPTYAKIYPYSSSFSH